MKPTSELSGDVGFILLSHVVAEIETGQLLEQNSVFAPVADHLLQWLTTPTYN